MTLALKSLRLMLIASAFFTAVLLVMWLVFDIPNAQAATYLNAFYLVASLIFTPLLAKQKTAISVLFLVFCFLLLIGSKMGGFTLTTFPAYIMTLLSFGGIAGIMKWFSKERIGQDDT